MESISLHSSDKARNRAAQLSLGVSILVFLMKVGAYYLTNSTAVLSDALESTVNVIAAGVALVIMRIVSRPADEDHPYGHGKLEYFSAAFEGGLIFFAALMIIRESVHSLIAGTHSQELQWGFGVVGVATVINLILAIFLKRVGSKEKSEALKASAAHVFSDVVTTVGVMVGLLLVMTTGWQWLDPVIAIIVAVRLAYEGFHIVRKSGGSLIDEWDPEVLQELADSFEKNRRPGVIDIHQLRMIRSGRFHHVDAHLVVPEYWNILHAHEITDDFEACVVRDYPFDGEIAFHLDPCKRAYCERCSLRECPIRRAAFQKETPFSIDSLVKGPHPSAPVEVDL